MGETIEALAVGLSRKNHSKVPIGTADHRSLPKRIVQTCSQLVWLTLTTELHPRHVLPCTSVLPWLRYTADTQSVGRARSPLRAGAARTGPAHRLESCFACPYARGYRELVMQNPVI